MILIWPIILLDICLGRKGIWPNIEEEKKTEEKKLAFDLQISLNINILIVSL